MDGRAIQQWLFVLDQLSYYEIFRLPKNASFDQLRVGFHRFAETFHPDVHTQRTPREQANIGMIFRRGAEAYRVLSDPTLRARYDEALANGILRPEALVVESAAPAPGGGLAPPAARLVDHVKNPGARPFVMRAEELAKKGDPKQAKIQLVMAMHMDPKNPALEKFAKELDAAAAKKKQDEEQAENAKWKR